MSDEPRDRDHDPAASGARGEPAPETEAVPVSSVPQSPEMKSESSGASLDLLLDVSLNVTVEVGRTRLPVEDILRLGPGSIVRLSRGANEPVELRVNGKLVAYGEVVVVGECYAIRLVQIVDAGQRVASVTAKDH